MPNASDRLYTVTQLGADLGVTARALRFYEDKGLISPRRAGTTRVYTHRDRARMILILRGKRLGFSLREIKEYLDLYEVDDTRGEQLRVLLAAVRSRIGLLEEQSAAVAETLAELRQVEEQAARALGEPAVPPRRAPAARRRDHGLNGAGRATPAE